MGGGGGGDTVTNVTNTGLGDDQYQSLYDNQGTIKENQGNIASSLDAQREEAATAYDTMYGRLDTQDTDLSNILAGIGIDGDDPSGLYKQFATQSARTATKSMLMQWLSLPRMEHQKKQIS